MSAMQQGQPKPILRKAKAPSRNLFFADSIEYTACKGYQNPKFSAGVVLPPTHCMSTLPSLKFGSAKPFEFRQEKIVQITENNTVVHHNTSSSHNFAVHHASSSHNDVSPPNTDHATTSGTKEIPSTQDQEEDPHGYIALENLVDDMAFHVWECSRRLSMGHSAKDCTRKIRCRICFRYGHFRKDCFDWKQSKSFKWVAKQKTITINEPSVGSDIDSHLEAVVLNERDGSASTQIAKRTPAPVPDSSPPVSLPSTPPLTPPPCPAMTNFEVDPTPWLPHGHQVIDGGPTRLPRTFYSPSVDPP
jgi:hypothetical protein